MEAFLEYIDAKLMPLLAVIVENRYIRAIRDAFITYTLPMIVVGSVFLILAYPPIPQNSEWPVFQMLNAVAAKYRDVFLVPFNFSFGLMAVWVAFGTAASLAETYDLPGARIGLSSVAALLVLVMPIGTGGHLSDFTLEQFLKSLGGEGMFVAILTAFVTVEINRFLYAHGLIIKMPAGVPPAITRSFESMIPIMCVLTLACLVEWYVATHVFSDGFSGRNTLPGLILALFEPLIKASDTYPSALLQILLMMLLWSLGIHGMNMVAAIAYPFWGTNLAENVAFAATGQTTMLPHIVTEPFFHIYAHLGGSGATLPLVFYLLRSKSKQLRQIGKIAFLPGIFNINEPVTFGVPIAFNPVMIVPFVTAPVVIVTLNYTVMSLGIVPKPLFQIPSTIPIPLGGMLSNQHWSGGVLQLVDLCIAALIYFPFFKIWERTLLRKEQLIVAEK